MVDALVSVAAENLLRMARDEALLLTGLRKELEGLSSELRTIRAVLRDAEMKQIKDEAVRIWLRNLKYVAHEIEDMLEEWDIVESNSGGHQVSIFSSPFSCIKQTFRHHKFWYKVKTIKERLEKIASEKDKYHFREIRVREIEERQTSSLVDQSSIIGRDGDKETLRRKLIEGDFVRKTAEEVPAISIVGMGGLGKTTLAQLVFNDEEIRSNFDKCIWVCISNDFSVKDIMINIVKNGGGSIYMNDDDQVELIQQEVVKVIGNKRYLLILDDVWNEDELIWEPLQSILNCGANGSRVIVTTRNRGVAHAIKSVYIHDLGLLSKDVCWSIFRKIVFEESNDIHRYKDLEEVGKQIVAKCGGLPLAVKTIASALRKKVRGKQPTREQLVNILNNEIWDAVKYSNVGILPALMLSYIELPPELKNCFCYCSLFEKDFVFEKDLLTKLWVAQGYIVANDEQRDAEYMAEEYFNELLDRSLFQEPKVDEEYGIITSCKMHDLVQWVTKTEFSIMKMTPSKNRLMSLGNARHCAILGELQWKRDIASTGVENLRTLIYLLEDYKRFDKCNIGGVIKQLQSIRVLSLQRVRMRGVHGLERLVHLRYLSLRSTKIKVLPKSIGKLKELLYLDLSLTEIERLPKAITSLSHLQMLNLSHCVHLMELPDGMHKMNSLRHLDNTMCQMLAKLPDGIGRLRLLQTLNTFPITRGGGGGRGSGSYSNIGELGGLNRLRGGLAIEQLGQVVSGEEARTARLKAKTSLAWLALRWSWSRGDEVAVSVLEGLRPPPQLQSLGIHDYPGRAFPGWMGDASSLLHLRHLTLEDCKSCIQLPPLGQLPCLKHLEVKRMTGVEIVGGEFLHLGLGDNEGATSIVVFPQLESLCFCDMSSWEQWVLPPSSISSSLLSLLSSLVLALVPAVMMEKKVIKAQTTILPRLRELRLDGCPKLERVPPIFTTALQTLRINNCPALPSLKFLPPSIQSLTLGGVSTQKLLADCATSLPSLQHLEI